MLLAEGCQDRRQNLGAHDLAGTHPDRSSDGAALARGSPQHGGCRRRQCLGVGFQLECSLSGCQSPLGPDKEFEADGLLERIDMASDGRLGKAQRPGGARQRALLQNCEEGPIEVPAGFCVTHLF